MFKMILKEEKYFDMFIDAAKNIQTGAKLLKEMMDYYQNPEGKAKEIKDIEHQGDKITHEINKKLNQTFVTPLDREDIYSLTCTLDDVIDLIEAVADRMIIFKIKEPTRTARDLADIICKSADEIIKGVTNLKKMEQVYEHCVEINRLENEADRITKDALGRLFEDEKDPVSIIKWKEIYENLEETTDRCEDVANILEGIVMKYA